MRPFARRMARRDGGNARQPTEGNYSRCTACALGLSHITRRGRPLDTVAHSIGKTKGRARSVGHDANEFDVEPTRHPQRKYFVHSGTLRFVSDARMHRGTLAKVEAAGNLVAPARPH